MQEGSLAFSKQARLSRQGSSSVVGQHVVVRVESVFGQSHKASHSRRGGHLALCGG